MFWARIVSELRPCRAQIGGRDSSHPDVGPAGPAVDQAKRLAKPIRSSVWKHCSTVA
jgi:hypothetical protein